MLRILGLGFLGLMVGSAFAGIFLAGGGDGVLLPVAWGFGIALPAADWYMRRNTTRGLMGRASSKAKEAELWIERVRSTGKVDPPDTGHVLVPAGQTALLSEPSSVAEYRSDGRTTHLGTRVKIGSMPIYLGQSQRSSRKLLQEVARGQLVLSNAALLFVSPQKTMAIKIEDIIGVESMSDSIVVNVANRANPLLATVDNPLLWGVVIRLLAKGDLEVHTPRRGAQTANT